MSEPTIEEMIRACEYEAQWYETAGENTMSREMHAAAGILKRVQCGELADLAVHVEPLTPTEIRMAGQRAGMMMAAAFLDKLSCPGSEFNGAAKLIRQEVNRNSCNENS